MLDALAHYRILEHIGDGGIGDVYRARDTQFGRTTFIKVARSEIADDPKSRQQFLRQARALKTLSHPNIATLFDVGEEGRELFLALEYVPGETLRSVIAGRPLNVRRALDFGVELADALADGHARELVHGDIASHNVIVTPTEHAKLLDFGLSAWTRSGAARRHAVDQHADNSEVTLRAAEYLSPEEAVGEAIDHRSDIYSLGVVLFEMLTGRTPFAEATAEATVLRVAQAKPVRPSSLNENVPAELDSVIQRVLSKSLDDRRQSAAALAAELRSVAAILDIRSGDREPPMLVSPRPTRRRRRLVPVLAGVVLVLAGVAGWVWRAELVDTWRRWFVVRVEPVVIVLPLQTSDGERHFFTDGLTDDLVTRLGQTPGMMVVGRSSIRSDRGDDSRELARGLGAGAILAGSVQFRTNPVAIDVELRRPADGRRFWGDRFEGERDRIFAVQTEIAEAVARALHVSLEPSAARARKKSHVVRPSAYALYLQGLAARAQHDSERAIDLFEQAVAEDAGLAEAHAGLLRGPRNAGGPQIRLG